MPTTDNVHLATFRARAKSLHRSVKAGNRDSLDRIRPYFADASIFKLTQAQLVVARELGASSWRELAHKADWQHCSFCKKYQYELSQLIGGPDGVHVCYRCVELCNQIIYDHGQSSTVK